MKRRVLLLAPVLLAACAAPHQSALEPAGPQAEIIARLWWAFLAITGVVWLVTLGFFLYALIRGRRRTAPADDPRSAQLQLRGVVIATIATVVVLLGLALTDFFAVRQLGALAVRAPEALTIRVTGHQWWWEITYEDSTASRSLTTANELHIPVGRPVLLRVTSHDVIHSLWIPNLHGKRDLIPGYTSSTWIRADSVGVYRGQCAEFCGHQHAKMALLVIAEPEAEFAAWYSAQLEPARVPADSLARRGQEIFLAAPCVMCHAIRGTPAGGRLGPELTHLASRRTLAAGTLPNRRGQLAGWILDPQHVKPGNRMPSHNLEPAQLQALLHYLESLR